tara:strand:- start:1273 stop:1515 length:243 start_codon:yes stop_codon:yes gene_type:complete
MKHNRIILSLLGGILIGCSPELKPEQNQVKSVPKSLTAYDVNMSTGGTLLTVEHDKHLFIVEARYNKGAILHHPDCPCNK